MTAIKPIANRRVVAVAAETYPMNPVCAHPECDEPSADPHHCFPRSAIAGDSYFVSITFDSLDEAIEVLGKNVALTVLGDIGFVSGPVPHCVGLCREHHDIVELREAQIALADGVYLWCDIADDNEAVEVGELNPQPGATQAKPKRSRLKGAARRKRRTISIRVPDDTENGGEVWDDVIDRAKGRLIDEELYNEGDKIPTYEAVVAGLNDWLN